MKFKDTLLRIQWHDIKKELPPHDFCFCVVKVKIGKEIVDLWAEWLVTDIAKARPDLKEKEPKRKFPVFKQFRFPQNFDMPEVYLGDKNWKKIKAWGFVEREKDLTRIKASA